MGPISDQGVVVSVTVSTVEASRPDGLTAAAAQLGDKVSDLTAALDSQRAALADLRTHWHGQASAAAIAAAERDIAEQERLRARLQALQEALQSGGADLSAARDGLMRVVAMLRATGWTVTDDGQALPPPIPPILRLFAPGFTAVIQRLLAIYEQADAATAAAVSAAVGGVPAAPPAPGLPAVPSDAGAEEVNRWWNGLTASEQQQLIAERSAQIGNLDGVPVEARNRANLAAVAADVGRVEEAARRHGVSAQQVADNPEQYGLRPQDQWAYTNARKVRDGLAHQAGGQGDPVYLFGYDPLAYDGQGTAAIAIGNPDTADNVAVIVPGTGSSVASEWLSSGRDDGINLWNQMSAAEPDQTHAVLLWMGYDAPDGFSDPRIANPTLARQGGALLAGDVNTLGVTHAAGAAPKITVLGHSYGSTTVADAFTGSGMKATNAVLIGCPGTDLAHSAADFGLDGGQVYVGAASTDPVAWLGAADVAAPFVNGPLAEPLGLSVGLGGDPAAESFGAVRFHAEVPGSDGVVRADHSYYYTMGSESLYSMAAIASGHGDALGELGMLAPERTAPTISTPDVIDTPFGRIDVPQLEVTLPVDTVDPEAVRDPGSVTSDHKFDGTNPL